MHLPTKIPMLLGIFMVVFVVGGLIVGSESYFRTATTASGSIQPANIQTTNVSDTTFTISWTTELAATGAITLSGPSVVNQVLFDEQDTGEQGKYTTHSVTYRNARPDTTYSVVILSNGKKHEEGGRPLSVRTGPALSGGINANLEPSYGTIISADNQPVYGALVYVTLEGGQTLSTVTKRSGTWLVPLNITRTTDLSSYVPVTERMSENIIIRYNGQETTAVTDTLNDSPIPDMILGKTYDFRRANAKAPGKDLALLKPTPQSAKTQETVLGATTSKPANTVSLIIPAEGAALPTTLPLIQGTGIPGKIVSLAIGITKPFGDSTTVAADGQWSYTPSKPLSPGKQSVTMTTQDINNKPVAVTHVFEILKSGTQVLGDATPSATITPTATATATPTPISELIVTPTPESTLAAQTPPTSGNELPTIILLIMGVALMVGGGIVFIK